MLAAELFSLFAGGAVRAEPAARDPRPVPEGLPRLNPLCLALAPEGLLATPRHQAIDLDGFGVRCARLLDGGQDPDAVVGVLQRAVAGGEIPDLSGAVTGPDAVRANVERLLALFHRHGVLAG